MSASTRRVSGGSLGAAVALGFVAVAVGVRFVTRSPLWLDEALSVNIARLPFGDIPGALQHDGHPPLYYFVLHGWTAVFGTSDVAVRALSGVLSVATLPLAWAAGRRVAGVRGGAWAVVLFGVSPYCVRYATEARMYSLVMLVVLAGTLLLHDALDRSGDTDRSGARRQGARFVGLGVASAVLLLTHYWSVWLLGVVVAALLVMSVRDADSARRSRERRAALSIAAGALALVPWLPSLLDQVQHTGTPWGDPVRPTSALAMTLDDFGGGDFAEAALLGCVMVVLVLLGLFAVSSAAGGAAGGESSGGDGVASHRVELDMRAPSPVRAEVLVAGATLLVGTGAGWLLDSTYASRYAAVVVPLALVAAARGLAVLPTIAQWLAGAAVVGLSLVGVGSNIVEARTQADVLADAIEADAVSGDVVAYCPDQLGPAVHRALSDVADDLRLSQVTFPALGSPERVDWYDYGERVRAGDPVAFARAVDERAGPRGNVWYVSSGAYTTHPDVCGEIADALRSLRPQAQLVVAEDPDEYFEHAMLTRYRARAR